MNQKQQQKVITCPKPTNPEGRIVPDLPVYKLGSVITYECNKGFKLANQVAERICLPSGKWSDEDAEPFYCERKSHAMLLLLFY